MRSRIALLAFVAASMLIAGCSSNETAAEDVASTAASTPTTEISVVAEEFGYDAPQWTIPAGTPVAVHFENHGTMEHEWAILKRDRFIDRQRDFTERLVLTEIEKIDHDRSANGTITIDEPGRYQVICALQGHLDAGMTAVLNVV